MSKTIRIDEETYGLATISKHQQYALQEIFTKLSEVKTDFTILFDYDTEALSITTSAFLTTKKVKIELPFIKRQNRIFRRDNVLILEKFLFSGENMIYILNDIFSNFVDEIKFRDLVANLKCFEFDTGNEV